MKLKRKLILKNNFSIYLLYKVIGLITFLLKCSVYFEQVHHIALISVPHVSHLSPWYMCVCEGFMCDRNEISVCLSLTYFAK